MPAGLAIGTLLIAQQLYRHPRDLEIESVKLEGKGLPRVFWLYLAAVAFVAAGYADFALVAFHLKKVSIVSDSWIPALYALAMGVDAMAALVFGRLFDRAGLTVLVAAALISAPFAPLVFLGNSYAAAAGIMLWGIGMGAQESIMRAAVAGMTSSARRGTAYGVFNTGYGISWFLGSALMGALYDISVTSLIAFSMAAQLASIPLLFLVSRASSGVSSPGR